MNELEKQQIEGLLASIQQFHSLVGIACPTEIAVIKKDATEIIPAHQEGSRVFITSKLFEQLEASAATIQDAAINLPVALAFASETSQLLQRIKTEGRHGNPVAINEAIVLLYLASGLAQHSICATFQMNTPATEQFGRVKSVEQLMNLCKPDCEWEGIPIERVFDEIIARCRQSLT